MLVTMKARYRGGCRDCRKPIRIGQLIENSGQGRRQWVHATCNLAPVRPKHIPDVYYINPTTDPRWGTFPQEAN